MTAPGSPKPVAQGRPGLNTAATVALVIGAVTSLALLFRAARNAPPVLIFLYTGWVLLPFAGLEFARRKTARLAPGMNATMQALALLVVAKTLFIYVGATLIASAPRPAAVFLMTPLASWVIMATVFAVAAARARTPSSQSKQV